MNMFATITDLGATEWLIDDAVVRLREWGTDSHHWLPGPPWGSVTIGTADTCTLRLVDRSGYASREHARVERVASGWIVRDLGSANGTRIDGARRFELRLEPGIELGIGGLTLLAESRRFIELRSFIARLLGRGAGEDDGDRLRAPGDPDGRNATPAAGAVRAWRPGLGGACHPSPRPWRRQAFRGVRSAAARRQGMRAFAQQHGDRDRRNAARVRRLVVRVEPAPAA